MRELEHVFDEWLQKLYREFEAKTPKSRELFERSRRVLPGGVTYTIRFYNPYPAFIARAKGPYVWDVDDNQYVDFWMGHGTNIMGHSPDFVVEAVSKVTKEGIHLGYENPYAVEYAEFLTKILPGVEQVRFCVSGTESNMYALRLARAYTRRRYVVKMEGGWHGGLDQLHIGVYPPYNVPETAGLPEDFVKYTIVVPFNDVDAVEKALKSFDVAAVIVEPVLGAGGCIESREGYLRELRRLTEAYGALLIFDEVITGFRLALGGAQEFFNVRADLVVYGKIIGGGYPGAGAFGGRAEIMELLDHFKHPNPRERSGHGGTFTGNPVNMVAGYTLIKHLYEHRSMYEEFNNLWNYARQRIQKICEGLEKPCWATGAGSMVGIHFTEVRPWSARDAATKRWSENVYRLLHVYMRLRGILYMTEHTAHLLPAMVHTKEHAEQFLKAFEDFVDEANKLIKQNV